MTRLDIIDVSKFVNILSNISIVKDYLNNKYI